MYLFCHDIVTEIRLWSPFRFFRFFLPNKYSWHLHLVCHGNKMWGGLFLYYFLTWLNKNQRKKRSFSSFWVWIAFHALRRKPFKIHVRWTDSICAKFCRVSWGLISIHKGVAQPHQRMWCSCVLSLKVDFPCYGHSSHRWSFLVWSSLLAVRSQSGDRTLFRFAVRCLTAGPWAQPHELLCKVDVRKYLTNSARPTAGERRAAGEESRRGGLSPTSSSSRSCASLRVNAAVTVDGPFGASNFGLHSWFFFPHRLRARLICASRSTLLQPLPHTGFLRKEKVTLLKSGIIQTDVETEWNVIWLLRRFSARASSSHETFAPCAGLSLTLIFQHHRLWRRARCALQCVCSITMYLI